MNKKVKCDNPKDTRIILDILINDQILSDELEILNEELFFEFGLFAFLQYRLKHQINYFNNQLKKGEIVKDYFEYKFVGIKKSNKKEERGQIGLFIVLPENMYYDKHLQNLDVGNPFNKFKTNKEFCDDCLVNAVLKQNCIYGNIPISSDIVNKNTVPNCKKHVYNIINYIFENEDKIRILGSDGYLLNVNSELIHYLNNNEGKDCLFNLFLAIYFKNVIGADRFYYDCFLINPFKSHEIDIFLEKNQIAILLEVNVKVGDLSKDFKTKVFNAICINDLYDSTLIYYVTFGNLDKISKYLINRDNNEFRANHKIFPKIFDNLGNGLNKYSKNDLLGEFKSFVNSIGDDINKTIDELIK